MFPGTSQASADVQLPRPVRCPWSDMGLTAPCKNGLKDGLKHTVDSTGLHRVEIR